VPSNELGGDSFGYHEIDPDHIAFYLLDVCGHGVGAALLSVTAINVLRSAALPNTDFRDPGAVLAALNEAFPMERQHNMYFTIWYGVLQRSTGVLSYASGGHPPSVLRKADDSVVTLATPGIAIGMLEGMSYRAAQCQVGEGDRLHLVSDGTFEVETAPGEMLAFQAFVERLARSETPAEVLDWVRGLNGPGPLPDDFSLLNIQF
jgi:sigma-B regulation protein RsbU (phosphoserine phosphatase)